MAEADIAEHTGPLLRQALLVFAAVLLVTLPLVFFFVRKKVVAPLQSLSLAAREIAGGNYQWPLPPLHSGDHAEVGGVLQEMSRALQAHEKEALEGYRELEQTNRLLQQAYEQQEKTSDELSRSQKMHRALFENASDAIVISDHEDKILLFNKRAESFFRISREQVLGTTAVRLYVPPGWQLPSFHDFYASLPAVERGEVEMDL